MLETLPGYTLAELDREPAERVYHWLMIIQERAAEENRQMKKAESKAKSKR